MEPLAIDQVAGEAGEKDQKDRVGGKRKAYPKPLPERRGCFLYKRFRYFRQDGHDSHHGEDDPGDRVDEGGGFHQ